MTKKGEVGCPQDSEKHALRRESKVIPYGPQWRHKAIETGMSGTVQSGREAWRSMDGAWGEWVKRSSDLA